MKLSILIAVAFSAFVVNRQGQSAGENVQAGKSRFTKTIEMIVYDDHPDAECLVDFDKGVVSKPKGVPPRSNEDAVKQFTKQGIDAVGEGDMLVGIQMVAKAVPNAFWMDPPDLEKQLAKEKAKTPLMIRHDGQFPRTFVIKTQQGGTGIMQFRGLVPEIDGNPVGLEVQVKMLRKPKVNGLKTKQSGN